MDIRYLLLIFYWLKCKDIRSIIITLEDIIASYIDNYIIYIQQFSPLTGISEIIIRNNLQANLQRNKENCNAISKYGGF